MPNIQKLWALFSALIVLCITGSAYAGSGPAPVQLDSSLFRVSQVLYEPGGVSGMIVLYGSRLQSPNSQDAARMVSTDGGNSWSFAYLTGSIQTPDTDTGTLVCPPDSFCVGKVFARDGATSQIKHCDIQADGLTTSNCSLIPTFQNAGGGIALAGNGHIYVNSGSDGMIHDVDIATGTSVALTSCGTGGVAGGVINGYLYMQSSNAPTVGSVDYQRRAWNGTTSTCTGPLENVNNLDHYGMINISSGQLEGAVDRVTGNYFYAHGSTGRPTKGGHAGVCGDGHRSDSEQCDPDASWLGDLALQNQTCGSLLPDHTGTLSCDPVTCQFDTSACSLPPTCGNGTCGDGGETCSSCPSDCGPCCGNGAINAGEDCDGANLDGQSCASVLGAGSTGTLTCDSCQFDTDACTAPPTCGDGTCDAGESCGICPQDCGSCVSCGNGNVDVDEDCDGANLDGQTCASVLGAGSTGTLTCSSCSFNTTGCSLPPTCGDGTCNGTENCSTCPGDCDSCCGNGDIDDEEVCDGANLDSQTCINIDLGFVGGNLACDDSCQLDTSACTAPASCGDGACHDGETCSSCAQDCGSCCGNGTCEVQLGENPVSCEQDCGTCTVLVQLGDCTVICINPLQPKVVFNAGGQCLLHYTPPGSPLPAEVLLNGSAGSEMYISVQDFGTPTTVSVPPGIDHLEVVSNNTQYHMRLGNLEMGTLGTVRSAIWLNSMEARFSVTEDLAYLEYTPDQSRLDFNIDGTQGNLPAGFTVDVDVLNGSLISGPSLLSCGDGNIDNGEECDGDEMNGNSCLTEGFDTGTISCSDTCTLDISDCENGQAGAGGSGGSGGSGGAGGSGAGGEGNTSSTSNQTTGGNTTSSSSGEGGGDDSSNINAQGGGGCTVSQPTSGGQGNATLMILALVFGLGLITRRR